MKVCEDILDALFDLDDLVGCDLCGAPEEVSDLSMAEKIADHSAKFNVYDAAMSEMKAQLLQLLDQRPKQSKPLVSEVVTQRIAQQQQTMYTSSNNGTYRQSNVSNEGCFIFQPHQM